MSLFYRPIVTYPVRCSPSVVVRPINPVFGELANLFSALDDTFFQLENAQRLARKQHRRPYVPRFNIKENKDAYSLEGEVPGIDAKDLKIQFTDDGHTLQISGATVKQTSTQSAESQKPQTTEASLEEPNQEAKPARNLKATVEDEPEAGEEPANASAAADSVPAEQTAATPASTETIQQSSLRNETPSEQKSWVSERQIGSFQRTFRFPSKVDQESVKASLKDGILSITLPFARKPVSRTIEIQ